MFETNFAEYLERYAQCLKTPLGKQYTADSNNPFLAQEFAVVNDLFVAVKGLSESFHLTLGKAGTIVEFKPSDPNPNSAQLLVVSLSQPVAFRSYSATIKREGSIYPPSEVSSDFIEAHRNQIAHAIQRTCMGYFSDRLQLAVIAKLNYVPLDITGHPLQYLRNWQNYPGNLKSLKIKPALATSLVVNVIAPTPLVTLQGPTVAYVRNKHNYRKISLQTGKISEAVETPSIRRQYMLTDFNQAAVFSVSNVIEKQLGFAQAVKRKLPSIKDYFDYITKLETKVVEKDVQLQLNQTAQWFAAAEMLGIETKC